MAGDTIDQMTDIMPHDETPSANGMHGLHWRTARWIYHRLSLLGDSASCAFWVTRMTEKQRP